jgi:hypothetical protein
LATLAKKVFTCKNPACKKTFSAPLKTLNLQQEPAEPYYACPFCLTEINEKPVQTEATTTKVQLNVAQIQEKIKQAEAKSTQNPSTCRFHLGYLSERTSKEQIPEECLVCKDSVDCMLRKMKN